jgi:hypothetical protein
MFWMRFPGNVLPLSNAQNLVMLSTGSEAAGPRRLPKRVQCVQTVCDGERVEDFAYFL